MEERHPYMFLELEETPKWMRGGGKGQSCHTYLAVTPGMMNSLERVMVPSLDGVSGFGHDGIGSTHSPSPECTVPSSAHAVTFAAFF